MKKRFAKFVYFDQYLHHRHILQNKSSGMYIRGIAKGEVGLFSSSWYIKTLTVTTSGNAMSTIGTLKRKIICNYKNLHIWVNLPYNLKELSPEQLDGHVALPTE